MELSGMKAALTFYQLSWQLKKVTWSLIRLWGLERLGASLMHTNGFLWDMISNSILVTTGLPKSTRSPVDNGEEVD